MKKQNQKGITLVALVITIIVLLILAGIGIAAISNGGILDEASNTKTKAEIIDEKQLVQTAAIQAMNKNKYGFLTAGSLEAAINRNKPEEVSITIYDESPNYVVEFNGKDRYYLVNEDGQVSEFNLIKDPTPGSIATEDSSVYEIWSIEDLVTFRNMASGNGIIINDQGEPVEVTSQTKTNFSGKTVKLMKDLDFSSKLSYTNASRTDFGDINGDAEDGNALITEMTTGTGFNPIGSFTGSFDGQGHEVKNLYINTTVAAGFFGNSKANEIRNLTISGDITTTTHAAGIVGGYGSRANLIENCCNKVNITSTGTGECYVSGISVHGAKIINCHNEGNISNTGRHTNGISLAKEIENCYNTGTITGNERVSGIGGETGATIKNCYNTGDVSRKLLCRNYSL